jgi:MtN3 and saliva related transmembrane protein
MWTELIGWSAAVILLLTISRQVYTQWRERSTQGMSRWLFIGQLAASSGFVVYSWQLGNWVFVATNLLMLATAGVGQSIYVHNKRREERAGGFNPRQASRGTHK